MGGQISASQANEDGKKTPQNENAPMFTDISEYQNCKMHNLTECYDIWGAIFNLKRLVSFHEFDDIFGSVLGDPDWHFQVFTGDDVKRRIRAKMMALNQLRMSGALDKDSKERDQRGTGRKRSGSLFRSSIAGTDARNFKGGGASDSKMVQSIISNTESLRADARDKTSSEAYKKTAMIDVYEVFSILSLVSDEEVESKLSFLFKIYGRSGTKLGGLDMKQFIDLIDRCTSAVYKLLGVAKPIPQCAELAVRTMFGRPENPLRDVLTFKDFWDWCQDDLEVAQYLQRILTFSLTQSKVYKEENVVNTDAYLQNSKLMDDDSDNEDEVSRSGGCAAGGSRRSEE